MHSTTRTPHSQEDNKNNIPGGEKEEIEGEEKKKKQTTQKNQQKTNKAQTQVPLFQMAPTAIPQRANTNFG